MPICSQRQRELLGLSKDDIKALEMKAGFYRKHLVKILDSMKEQEFGLSTNEENWVVKRAFQDGKVHAIKTIMQIVGESE